MIYFPACQVYFYIIIKNLHVMLTLTIGIALYNIYKKVKSAKAKVIPVPAA